MPAATSRTYPRVHQQPPDPAGMRSAGPDPAQDRLLAALVVALAVDHREPAHGGLPTR